MAQQNIGSLRLGDSEPEELDLETEEVTAEYEGQDDDDDDEGYDGADEDPGFETRAEAIRAYDQTEDEAAEADADNSPIAGFRVVWSEPDEDGIIYLTMSGQVAASVHTEQRGERTIYTSPEFKGEQTTMKSALTSIGRNIAARSVSAAWDRANPKQRRETKPRTRGRARDQELEALKGDMDVLKQGLQQLLELQAAKQGGVNGAASEESARVRLGGSS